MSGQIPYPNPSDFWTRCKGHLDSCSAGMFVGVFITLIVVLIVYCYMMYKSEKFTLAQDVYSPDPNTPSPAMQSLINQRIRADPPYTVLPQEEKEVKEFFENKSENPELVKLLWR
jgi:hypothetical protein